MKYAIVFTIFGLTCAVYAVTSQFWPIKILATSFAIAFCGVGLAYAFIGPKAFLKRSTGQLSWLSYILYWPYHGLNTLALRATRKSGHENAFDKIAENVYLGCQLGASDQPQIENLGFTAVLDLTCEFSETPHLRGIAYHCIPTLDTYAPSLKSLQTGANWIQAQATQGPVYVHCALGHGRSATFVAAYLLLSGQAQYPQQAIDQIKKLRPKIGLHPAQIARLEEFSRIEK